MAKNKRLKEGLMHIIIRRTPTGYQATLQYANQSLTGYIGGTPNEALGSLVADHADLFRIEEIEQYPKTPNRTPKDDGGDEFVN